MHLQTRFQLDDRISFYHDGRWFRAAVTALQVEVTKDAQNQPVTAIHYCFDVPPYVLPETACTADLPAQSRPAQTQS